MLKFYRLLFVSEKQRESIVAILQNLYILQKNFNVL